MEIARRKVVQVKNGGWRLTATERKQTEDYGVEERGVKIGDLSRGMKKPQ